MSTSAISAGHEVTLQLAQEILKMGGNAFDAAITAHLAMYITEPCMASAGAGGFALCHTPNSRVQMLDFFTQTPLEKRKIKDLDFYPIQVNFGNENEEFHVGAASMATPGSIAAIFELHRKLGSLPMDVLIDPVLDLAKNGVILNTFQKIDLDLLEPIFKNDPSVRNIFFKEGKLLNEGDLLYFPHFADFLEFLKKEKDEGFYKGEIGKKIADYAQEQGGFLQRKDFENYKAYWRPTITAKHFGHEVHLPNGPSIGGAIMFVLLSNFEKFDGNWLKAISQTLQECKSISGIEFQIRNRYPSMAFDLH
ncbi:MAG: hypothetical protein HKO66_16620 [Saprospiraceae bacterium]|nr:hypothetical protein [Saprospiraceae bacterium]